MKTQIFLTLGVVLLCVLATAPMIGNALRLGRGMSLCHTLRTKILVIGTSVLSVEGGASATELSEAAVKQQTTRRANRSILLVDSGNLAAAAPVLLHRGTNLMCGWWNTHSHVGLQVNWE